MLRVLTLAGVVALGATVTSLAAPRAGTFDPSFSPDLPSGADTSALLERSDGSLVVGSDPVLLLGRDGTQVRSTRTSGDEVVLMRGGDLMTIRGTSGGIELRTSKWRSRLRNLSSPRLARSDGGGGAFFVATRSPGASAAVVHVTRSGAYETAWFEKRAAAGAVRYARDLVVGTKTLTFLASSSKLPGDQILRLSRSSAALEWRAPAKGAVALAPAGASGVMAIWREDEIWGSARFDSRGRVDSEFAFPGAFAPRAVARDDKGRFLVAGSTDDDCVVARLRADGRLDTRFGRGGYAVRTTSGTCRLSSVIAADGGYVVGGRARQPFLARLYP